MSESDVHRSLVLRTAHAVRQKCTQIATLLTDAPTKPGDPVPPLVEGYRPDLYGTGRDNRMIVLGEIETLASMRSPHTIRQIGAFLRYLEGHSLRGLLVLAAEGRGADRAKVLLGFLVAEYAVETTSILVYDGLDFWHLGTVRWRLL